MRVKSEVSILAGVDEPTIKDDPHWQLAGRVARSSAFSRAIQLRTIFLFIVQQAILSPEDPVHEFEIAHQVLGRGDDFNPLDDNIVRVQMARLRKKLELYFSTEGRTEEIVITIGLGSYKPVFSHRSEVISVLNPNPEAEVTFGNDPASGIDESPGSAGDDDRSKRQRLSGPFLWTTLGLIVAIFVLATGWLTSDIQNRAMRRAFYPWRYSPSVEALWSGFLDANQDTDVVLSDTSFAMLQKISKKSFSLQDYVSRSYLGQLQAQDMSPEIRSVLSRVSAQDLGNSSVFRLAQRIMDLEPRNRKIHLYHSREYSPDLIKQDSVILLGSRIANPWEELFENRLNFSLVSDDSDLGTIINRAPAAGEEAKYVSADSVGYCVVAYLPNPDGNGKVLLIEGTSSEATEAAGDFLLSEDKFSGFQKKLNTPQLPYFEVLLKTSQVRGTPLTTALVAYRTYPNIN